MSATSEAGSGSDPMATNPFPGPRPFGQRDYSLFFGRDRELTDLVALLFAQRAVLLHAPSGAGKSSLVNAGLIPRACQRGFEFLPVARVRGTGPIGGEPTRNRYVDNVMDSWRAAGLDVPADAADLAEAIAALPRTDEPGRVVVFDQFEELFVLHPDRWRDRADLFSQVQGALDRDPFLHFLFVLRDDYLARLDRLAPRLRDRLSTRYQIGGLTPAQALAAVVRPFAAGGRIFAPGVAEDFVRALREQPAELAVDRSYQGEDVEPVQLQIVCRTFFERLPKDVTEIGPEQVGRHADVQQALVGFYEQAVAAVVRGHAKIGERRVRLWFERQLITPARTRAIVFRDERTTAGLPNPVVDDLEQRRLVRSEPRGPSLWYELTHDRLIDAVLGSNRVWYAKRSRLVTRRALAAAAACILVAAAVSFAVIRNRGGGSAPGTAQEKPSKISTPGQTVSFHVSGRAGQLATAIMSPDQGFLAELRMVDVQGQTIGAPSAAESSKPLLTQRLPADGDYQIQARGRGNSTGSFTLKLLVQTVGVQAPLTGPDPIPGSITSADQVDVYTFDGRAGALTFITMAGTIDTQLLMVGPGGQGFNAVSGESGGNAIAAVLPRDGPYEVHASSQGNNTVGPYRLQQQLPDNAGIQPGRVNVTTSVRNPAEVRTVRSELGGALTVSYPVHHGVSDNFSLVAANGDTIVADSGNGGFTSLIAPAATYILVVSSRDAGNPYLLSLGIQEPLPLTGGKADGQIVRAKQVVIYRLQPGPGDLATILVQPVGKFDPSVVVIQPDGTTLVSADSGGPGQDELFPVPLQQPGLHLLVISSSDATKTGQFHITVTQRMGNR